MSDADTVVNLTNHSYFTLGAARVEDLVACTEDGVEVLNHYSRDLVVVE